MKDHSEFGLDSGQMPIPQCPEMVKLFALEGVCTVDIAECPKECPTPGGIEVMRHRLSPWRSLLGDTVMVCSKQTGTIPNTDTLQTP